MDDKQAAVPGGEDSLSVLSEDVTFNMDDKKEAVSDGKDMDDKKEAVSDGKDMDDKKEAVPDGEDRLSELPEDVIFNMDDRKEAVPDGEDRSSALPEYMICNMDDKKEAVPDCEDRLSALPEDVIGNMDDKKEAVPDGEDRLSALPEDVILLLLSFLPTREAVQTCVLGPRWRTLWKSVPCLFLISSHSPDFINSLLRSRDPAPLDECVILVQDDCTEECHKDAERWLRYVVSCKVRVLTFEMICCNDGLQLSAGALASEHLTRLCVQCYGIDDCVLLKSLSGATNLELLRPRSTIFRRELKWRPMFSNLKRLLLCDWFMTANFSGLVYFLHHSPVLEMLALQLSNTKKIKTSIVYKPEKQFLVSKHLKAVEIEYCEEVGKIDEILNVLAYHGVQPEIINIETKPFTECSFFED